MNNDPYPIGDMGALLATIAQTHTGTTSLCESCVYEGCDCPTCNYVRDINEDEEDR